MQEGCHFPIRSRENLNSKSKLAAKQRKKKEKRESRICLTCGLLMQKLRGILEEERNDKDSDFGERKTEIHTVQ
jgi:hypothetical protein